MELSDAGEASSSSVIGNPYLGAEFVAAPKLLLAVGLRAPLTTADEESFADNSLHYAGATADVRVGGVRPGVSVRVPVDQDYRNLLRSTVGLYLQVPLR